MFQILYTNAGLTKNIENVRKLVKNESFHALCIAETHLTEKKSDTFFAIDGFNMERINTHNPRTGGVTIYIKNDLEYSVTAELSTAVTWIITINIHEYALNLTAFYRAPNEKKPNKTKPTKTKPMEFVEILKTHIICDAKQIIVGDFNLDLDPNKKPKHVEAISKYMKFLSEHNLRQIMTDYTRYDKHNKTETIIDHVIVSKNIQNVSYQIEKKSLSDHYLIMVTCKMD